MVLVIIYCEYFICSTSSNNRYNNLSHIQAVLEVPKPYDRMLTIVAGQKWKDIRNTLTPTFSAHKMKQVGGPPKQKLTYFFSVIIS